MNLQIDWVAVAIMIAANVFGQIKSVPLKTRNLVMAIGFAAIAGWRIHYSGFVGPNLIFILIAAAISVYYVVQALKNSPPSAAD